MTTDEAREALLGPPLHANEQDVDALIAAVRAESAETLAALREAATTLVRAYDANVDALNGKGHEGEPHNRDLWQRMPGDAQIYDQVGDCSACGGAQYGSEDDVQQAIVAVKEALGEPLRPYEEHRAALAATPADSGFSWTTATPDERRDAAERIAATPAEARTWAQILATPHEEQDAATPAEEWTEPQRVYIRSANCAAGEHGECLGMVEQDAPGLGITDCLCECHAATPAEDIDIPSQD